MNRMNHTTAGGVFRRGLFPYLLAAMAMGCGDSDDRYQSGSGNPAGVGNHCDENADCETNECYLGPGGGYCTSPCTTEGDTTDCPLDTVCKPIQGGPRRCLLICGSASTCDLADCPDAFCPTGSSCVSISGTTLQGCEPDPT
jgi:hypothetical protein